MQPKIRVTPDLHLVAPRGASPLTVDQAFRLARDLLQKCARRAVLDEVSDHRPVSPGRLYARRGR